jgi:CheY-like chemotaxis protein
VYREVGAEISPEDVGGPTRLAIVDDHELTRQSLQNMLSDEPDIEIVGEAANGRQALSMCSCSRPDLILMDVRMPVCGPAEAGIDRQEPVALDEAAGDDRAFHRPS